MAPTAGVPLRRFRIEQFGKTRIVGHVLEVGVATGLDTVLRVELDGGDQVLKALLGLSGHAVENGEAVVRVVGFRVLLEDAFELVGSVDGEGRKLVRAAYLDGVSRRVVRGGLVECAPREPQASDLGPLADEERTEPVEDTAGAELSQESATVPGGSE